MHRKIINNLSVIIGIQLIGIVLASVSFAAIIINSPMTDTNAAGWVMGGSPTSALLTGNGTIDPVGSGWLRLTDNTGNQTGFAYNTTTFDLSQGALIQFDYATWGGTGADGYSVFLFDANVPTFNIGAFGGSLGYAQKTGIPGISGGYMGIGIDEFGNFAANTEGRYNTTAHAAAPNTVTIRGSVTGFGNGAIGQTQGATSYPWIATSATSPSSLWYNNTPRPSQTGPDYRKVIIQISPAPNPVANVWIQFGFNTTPVQMITNQALPAITTSQQIKVGFGASTGGSTNYHEIHNLLITTLGESTSVDLGVTKTAVTTGTSTQINSILVGGSYQYQIVAANFGPNNITANGVGITDTFPAAITPGAWTCTGAGGATCGAASGSGNLNTTANLPKNSSVTYTVNATANSLPAGNLLSNTASLTIPGSVTDFYPGNNSVTSTINAYGPPTATKTFAPATVLASAPSVMTITLTNPNNIVATGVAFTDNYPANLVNTGTPAGTTTCTGGTVIAAANGTSLALSAGTIPANGSCTVTVNVTSATTGTYNNSTGALTSTNIGSGTAATGTLAVMAKPTVAKSFTPNQIGVNGTTALTVTLTNPNSAAITGAAFTDNYPANLVNTGTPNVATTCSGGTVTAAANGTSLALSGGTIPANGSCTVTVNVTSATAGTYNNSTGSVTTTNAGTGTAATGTLTVLLAPTVAKSFAAPGTILPGGTSVLTITLTNPNSTAITGASFTDNYPTNLVNTATPAGATICAGGTVTAAANSTSLALSGGTIPASGSCTVTANVTSTTAATYINSTGTVTTTNTGNGTAASGTLVVMTPPTTTKNFNPITIAVSGTTQITVTLTNPNSVAVTGAAFTDTYPANMKNTATPAGATTCAGGTVTAASNGTSLALSGGTIPANGSCTVTANVTITAAGNYTNSTGSITTTNAGTGTTATAILNGPQPPTLAKSFAPASIIPNATSVMTVTLSNANNFAITAATFTDNYPANLVNTGTPAGATTCAGGTVTAAANGTSLTLSGGTIPANGSCTVTVNATSATAGTYVNSTGVVTTGNTGDGVAGNGTLVVMAAPTATKTFTPASVLVNTPSVLKITLTNPNPNTTAITGVAFTDSYPAGLVNTTTASGATTCAGGTVTAANNGTSLALSGATIPASGSCTVTVNVTSATTNAYNNSTGPVTTTNAGNGIAASATLNTTLLSAATVAKSFAPASVPLNATSVLTITLTNPNATTITGAAFTDSFPAGLVNAAAANGATTCAGGTVTAANNGTSLALSGASIPAFGSCTVTVNVTSATAGTYNNSTGAVTSTNASTATAATATLAALAPPTAAKSFTPATIIKNDSSLLTITLANPNSTSIAGAAFTDNYPANLVNTAAPNGTTTCIGGTVTAAANGSSLALAGGTIPANGSCSVTVNVTSATVGAYNNSSGAVTTTNAGSGTAASATLTTTILNAPTVAKSFSPTQVVTNDDSLLTITLTNPNGANITGAAFTDTYPANLVNTATPNGTTTCSGGVVTAAANGTSLALSGATIPANGSCTATVSVSSGNRATYNNTTGTVTSSNATTSATASASLVVATRGAPVVVKTFTPNQVGVNDTSLLTVTLTNPNGSNITNPAFTDSYPAGLVNTASANGTTTCGGTVTAANNGTSLALSGTSIPANGSCTVTVNVKSAFAGSYPNSTGPVTTGNAGTGVAGSATLNVLQAPTIAKTFNPTMVPPNAASVMTITLTNPNSIAIAGVAFTDTYPAGLVNTSSASGSTTCGGTVTAANNGNQVALSGASIPGNDSCTVTVNVTSASTGSYLNSTGSIATTNAGTGTAATGTLNVYNAPTVAKSFAVPNLASGGNTNLTVTIGNTNAVAISLTSLFTDTFPAGMTINTAGNTGTCTGVNATTADNKFTIANGTSIPAGGCTVIVNVKSSTAGAATNIIAIGALQTTGGSNAALASATLNIYAPPTVTKTFTPASVPFGGTSSMVITVTNPAANVANLTAVSIADTYSGTLQNSAAGSVACSGAGTATLTGGGNGGTTVGFNAGTIVPGGTCTISQSVSATSTINNTTGAPAATGPVALTGTAAGPVTLTVSSPASLSKAYSTSPVVLGGSSTLTFTINNSATNPVQAGLSFTDTFPAGLTVTAVTAVSGTGCSGTPGFTPSTVTLSAGAITAGNPVCTFTATIRGDVTGGYLNNSARFSGQGGGLDTSSTSATLNVVDDATITVLKTADKATAKPGDIITYTLLFTNSGGVAASNISVSDVLSPYVAFGTNSYPAAPVPPGPSFDFFGSGSLPTPNSPQYFNSSSVGITPSGAYDSAVAKWTIPFTGSLGGGSNFTIRYKTQVK